MLRCILSRLALPAVLSAVLLPAASFAQSQDTQSVAEAARRAREQKKTAAKSSKVFTDDDVKPAAPDAAPASGFPAPAPGGPANPPAGAPGAEGSKDPKDQKDSKELADLKEQLKHAQNDLDLIQRELALAQDTYFSNPGYARDTAGKAKLDAQKQQVGDKQEEVARLKARILESQPPPDASAPAPAAPQAPSAPPKP